jgi:hypothetical protein
VECNQRIDLRVVPSANIARPRYAELAVAANTRRSGAKRAASAMRLDADSAELLNGTFNGTGEYRGPNAMNWN